MYLASNNLDTLFTTFPMNSFSEVAELVETDKKININPICIYYIHMLPKIESYFIMVYFSP